MFGFPEQVIKGELALVTGGGGGLGRLLALRLSKLGVDIVIWDINQEGEFFSLKPKIKSNCLQNSKRKHNCARFVHKTNIIYNNKINGMESKELKLKFMVRFVKNYFCRPKMDVIKIKPTMVNTIEFIVV